jgi:hypothetical protein
MVIQIMHHAHHKEVGLTRKTLNRKIIEHPVDKGKAHYLPIFTHKMIRGDQTLEIPHWNKYLKELCGG